MDITGGKGIMLGQATSWRVLTRAHRLPSPLKGQHSDPQHDDLRTRSDSLPSVVLEEMEAAKNNDVNAFDKLFSNISVTSVATKFAASGWA